MTGLRGQRLVQEGFGRLTDDELDRLDLPLRFTPGLCLLPTAAGTAARSAVVFGLPGRAGSDGGRHRRHPFDRVGEYLVRPVTGGPHLPKAPGPRRFAFVMATAILAGTALCLALGAEALGLGLAALQVAGCGAYVFAGWCGASALYSELFGRTTGPEALRA